MGVILRKYPQYIVVGPDGRKYMPCAYGQQVDDHRWEGWLEFVPLAGGDKLRSRRETLQPNKLDLDYWAAGLGPFFMEGCLDRTLDHQTAPYTPRFR